MSRPIFSEKIKKSRILSATNFAGQFRVKSESEIIQSQGQREWKSSKVLDKLVCDLLVFYLQLVEFKFQQIILL